jgi:hypothetical protein
MLTRALLVLLAMMTGLAAGPATAASRVPESTVSISVQSGGVDAARAEAKVARHAHLASAPVGAVPREEPRHAGQIDGGRTVERGDRTLE